MEAEAEVEAEVKVKTEVEVEAESVCCTISSSGICEGVYEGPCGGAAVVMVWAVVTVKWPP